MEECELTTSLLKEFFLMLFTPLQHQITSYLIAENEEIGEPNPLTPYLYALSGGFLPDIYFTLCRDTKA
jgi:hypothetical protein